jgi:hypothetical protein
MTAAQRKVTIGFSIAIGLTMAWGFCTYAYYWYQDLSLPAGSLDGAAFMEGRPALVVATIVSLALRICSGICYVWLGRGLGEREGSPLQRPNHKWWAIEGVGWAIFIAFVLLAVVGG